MIPEHIIKRPLVLTEKGNILREKQNTFLFEVDRKANKIQIRQAVETLFNVKVTKVRTHRQMGKMRRVGRHQGRRPDWKKAYVTLAEGSRIDFFEGA